MASCVYEAAGPVRLNQWWGGIGLWFAGQTPLSISAWTALLCVALAGGSYLTLRRATP